MPPWGLTQREYRTLKKLHSPKAVQDFLETIPANFELKGETCRSPRRVLRDKCGHCIEGALLAAVALRLQGYLPLLLDLKATAHDYDHVVAVWHAPTGWGAISKTNHAVLRYREPVYRTLRELVMSYFHEYFTDDGTKQLRSYSAPFNMARFDSRGWVTAEEDLWYVPQALDKALHYPILPPGAERGLRKADKVEIKAGKVTQWEVRR